MKHILSLKLKDTIGAELKRGETESFFKDTAGIKLLTDNPQNELKEIKDAEEQPCIYAFYLGRDGVWSETFYIGAAKDIYSRLRQHLIKPGEGTKSKNHFIKTAREKNFTIGLKLMCLPDINLRWYYDTHRKIETLS